MFKPAPYLHFFTALIFLGLGFIAPDIASAAGGEGAPHLDGAKLGLIWIVPFAGILLSIALFPLLAPHFWEHNFGIISAFWALCFMVPFTIIYGWQLALFETLHVVLLEYIPFIILLFALFTVAGGIRIKGTLVGTPLMNVLILLIGTAIASWMGTTGAAMLLIRPLLRANEHRKHKVHTFVFFIFLVANIGGSLTPLGDPPLFLGYLKGVSFFWPTQAMFLPMLMISILLLIVYFVFDTIMYARENKEAMAAAVAGEKEPIRLEGSVNLIFLLGVVAAVLLSGLFKTDSGPTIYHVHMYYSNILRDLALVGLALLSLKFTVNESRAANGFSWFPIVEVGKLFIGIFITIVPAIAILKAGTDGSLGFIINLVTGADGQPDNVMYFWATGILSSFLDNAPTYLVFFNTAGGDAEVLMAAMSQTLLAISAGAVFMGANTYIGNAPNFMVRAICEDQEVKMPSFFGYMIWSIIFLVPMFILVTFVFL